jgi:hypothetical protein
MRIGFCIALLVIFSYSGNAQPSPEPPEELVRRVITNEVRAEDQDHSHWMFQLETATKNSQKEIDEVLETKDGDLKRPIQINGRKLSAEESDKELERLLHNPDSLRKSLKEKSEDSARSQRLLKLLPDAFVFSYRERRGDLVQLNFKPNPRFHPASREAEVFHAMEGSLWLDGKQQRLAEIRGHLARKVKFGGGLLGHLDQGGTFEVRQEPVAEGYWELTALHVHMRGKALFFKTIGVQQDYSRSNFQRVPDDLSLAQGLQMLRKQASPHGSMIDGPG